MRTLKCAVEGCESTIDVTEGVTPTVKFTCREHMGIVESDVHFQNFQFDRDLSKSSKPEGTSHVQHQAETPKRRVRMPDGTFNE
jgi:hypothetical protein